MSSGRLVWRGKVISFRALAFAASLPVLAWAGVAAADLGPTGDTCTWMSGSGSVATFIETLPANAPVQGGEAVGAPGGILVTGLTFQGIPNSTFSNNALPPGTSGEAFTANPLNGPGAATVTVIVGLNGPVSSGMFNVVPTNYPASSYYAGVSCPEMVGSGPAVSNLFPFPPPTVYYDPITKEYTAVVNVPGPGVVTWGQMYPTHSTRQVAAAAKPLIQSGKVVAKHAGNVKQILRPTAAGKAVLKQKGVLSLRLKITFAPTGGTPASKTGNITLRAKK